MQETQGQVVVDDLYTAFVDTAVANGQKSEGG